MATATKKKTTIKRDSAKTTDGRFAVKKKIAVSLEPDEPSIKQFLVDTYKYWDRLFNIAMPMLKNRQDSEDAVQDVIIKASKKQKQFEYRSQVYTWLVRILINHCHDILRVSKRKSTSSLDDTFNDSNESRFQITDKSQNLEKKIEQTEAYERLSVMLGKLDSIYKEVVVLRYFEEMKYAKIAQTLQISEGTVKSRLNNAKRILKTELEVLGVNLEHLLT